MVGIVSSTLLTLLVLPGRYLMVWRAGSTREPAARRA
jgi:Cu/Ag efflux pump CusA